MIDRGSYYLTFLWYQWTKEIDKKRIQEAREMGERLRGARGPGPAGTTSAAVPAHG